MYPRMWAATGVDYPALVDRLIQLALRRDDRSPLSRASLARSGRTSFVVPLHHAAPSSDHRGGDARRAGTTAGMLHLRRTGR